MPASKTKARAERRTRRHQRVRKKIAGSSERPRLVVFRSLKHIEGQLVNDLTGTTLLGLHSSSDSVEGKSKSDRARAAGKAIAEKARAQGITKVVFDRGGYLYHGRVRAFAEGAREGGLEF